MSFGVCFRQAVKVCSKQPFLSPVIVGMCLRHSVYQRSNGSFLCY
jgi:hypothetical protein